MLVGCYGQKMTLSLKSSPLGIRLIHIQVHSTRPWLFCMQPPHLWAEILAVTTGGGPSFGSHPLCYYRTQQWHRGWRMGTQHTGREGGYTSSMQWVPDKSLFTHIQYILRSLFCRAAQHLFYYQHKLKTLKPHAHWTFLMLLLGISGIYFLHKLNASKRVEQFFRRNSAARRKRDLGEMAKCPVCIGPTNKSLQKLLDSLLAFLKLILMELVCLKCIEDSLSIWMIHYPWIKDTGYTWNTAYPFRSYIIHGSRAQGSYRAGSLRPKSKSTSRPRIPNT